MRSMNRGFTLVELSIVLVIIGLLLGGIMAGKSLIHNAKLRGIASSFLSFDAAVHNFRDQYNYLPGDMPTATKYWSTAYNGPGAGTFGNYSVGAYSWQHLGLAGLIAGTFPGTQAGAAQGMCVGDTECPSATIETLVYLPVVTIDATPPYTIAGKSGILLYDGGNVDYGTGGLIPADAANLDLKLDDGFPGTGKVFGIGSGGFGSGDGYDNCSVDAAGSNYALSTKTTVCRLFYIIN